MMDLSDLTQGHFNVEGEFRNWYSCVAATKMLDSLCIPQKYKVINSALLKKKAHWDQLINFNLPSVSIRETPLIWCKTSLSDLLVGPRIYQCNLPQMKSTLLKKFLNIIIQQSADCDSSPNEQLIV